MMPENSYLASTVPTAIDNPPLQNSGHKTLKLKKNEDKRLKLGHLWVYSNEIDTDHSPLTHFNPGDTAVVLNHQGQFIGQAYINPHSLICARIYSRQPEECLDQAFFQRRIHQALSLREQLFNQPYYRLVHGEGDDLPGLIVDRFGDACVIQLNTAGMERAQDALLAALHQLLQPHRIILRNDSPLRQLEGLAQHTAVLFGPAEEDLVIHENDCRFHSPVLTGQKTGWFYDHRLNRSQLFPLLKNRQIVDLFSYLGAFGIQAACHGAAHVTCVESGHVAAQYLAQNAQLNQVSAKISLVHADVITSLKQWIQTRQLFDVVIADPPAYIKRKKDLQAGLKAYFQLYKLAFQVLKPGGVLLAASCSHHLSMDMLLNTLNLCAQQNRCRFQVIGLGHQAADHPVHPAIVETHYLKSLVARRLN